MEWILFLLGLINIPTSYEGLLFVLKQEKLVEKRKKQVLLLLLFFFFVLFEYIHIALHENIVHFQ